MKKTLIIIITIVVITLCLTSCSNQKADDLQDYTFATEEKEAVTEEPQQSVECTPPIDYKKLKGEWICNHIPEKFPKEKMTFVQNNVMYMTTTVSMNFDMDNSFVWAYYQYPLTDIEITDGNVVIKDESHRRKSSCGFNSNPVIYGFEISQHNLLLHDGSELFAAYECNAFNNDTALELVDLETQEKIICTKKIK